MKFKVNSEACICCGACAAICEDVFEISDEEVKEQAVEAMESCPTSAIEEAE